MPQIKGIDVNDFNDLDTKTKQRIHNLELDIRKKANSREQKRQELNRLLQESRLAESYAATELNKTLAATEERLAASGLYKSGALNTAKQEAQSAASRESSERGRQLEEKQQKINQEMDALEQDMEKDRSDIQYAVRLAKENQEKEREKAKEKNAK